MCVRVLVYKGSTHWSRIWSNLRSLFCLLEENYLQKREANSTMEASWYKLCWCEMYHQGAVWVLEGEPDHSQLLQHSRDPMGLHTLACHTLWRAMGISSKESQNSSPPNCRKFSIELWRAHHCPLSNRSLLNSRPLGVTPHYNDKRMEVITPGHFLRRPIDQPGSMWSTSTPLLEEIAVRVSHKSPKVLQGAQTSQEFGSCGSERRQHHTYFHTNHQGQDGWSSSYIPKMQDLWPKWPYFYPVNDQFIGNCKTMWLTAKSYRCVIFRFVVS